MANPDATEKEIQLLILEAEKDGELFQSETVTTSDGKTEYIITRTSLTDEQYDDAKAIIEAD